VHGERKYPLSDEGLLRKRAGHLGIKARELAKALESLEERILRTVAELHPTRPVRSGHAMSR
jgi:hypothetical protein